MSEIDHEEHYRRLERLYASAPINRYFAPRLRVSDGQAEVIIEVRDDFFHAARAVHGSIYFKALDDAAFFAANSVVREVFVLTATFNLYFLRPVTSGTLIARGTLVNRSRNLLVAEAILSDGQGKQVGRGSGTFARSNIVLNDEVGYA